MQSQTYQKRQRWTILDVLQWTADYFTANGIDAPRLTAEILLADSLGVERIDLYLRFDQPLSSEERERFKCRVKRRACREPVAYILGYRDFWKIRVVVTPDVLIPRPETEILVEAALEVLEQRRDRNRLSRVIDMGTGSGAIAVSLACSIPHAEFFASDISPAALKVASRNAGLNAVENRIRFFSSYWFEALSPGSLFDLIVSNPPYIASAEISGLEPEVSTFEPMIALDGDADGLRDISVLISESSRFLSPGGILMLEIGHDQKEAVVRLAESEPSFSGVDFRKDYSGYDRVAILTRNDTAKR